MLSWWIGIIFVIVSYMLIIELPFYGRQTLKRWPGAVSFVLALVALRVLKMLGPSDVMTFQQPDNLNNRVLNEVAHHYYQHGGEIFWNPYIFCGMPHFPYMTHNFSIDNPFIKYGKLLLIPFFIVVYIYTCFRLRPSVFEKKLYRLAVSKIDGFPVMLIAGLCLWALMWGIRAAVVAIKAGYL